MKKLVSLLLALLMIFNIMSFTVFASTDVKISINKAVVTDDSTVCVNGVIENASSDQMITIMAAEVTDGKYNEDKIVYVDQKDSWLTSDGDFTLTFNAKEALDETKSYIVYIGGSNVKEPASILLFENSEVIYGDVNGDGILTMADASLALQYVLDKNNVSDELKNDSSFLRRLRVSMKTTPSALDASYIAQKVLDKSFVMPCDDSNATTEATTEEIPTETTTAATESTTAATESTTQKQEGGDVEDTTTEGTTEKLEFEGDILVDCNLSSSIPSENRYKTITEAIASITTTPTEATRVVIDIVPGVYREQIVLNTPYLTLRKHPNLNGEVKHTWYYGTGSMYDSVATSGNLKGFYDPAAIGDGEAGIPSNWGAPMNVNSGAVGLTIENITFENSYNQYYTQEELNDGLTVNPDKNNSMFDRHSWIDEQIAKGTSDDVINQWLQSRTSFTYKGVTGSTRERAAAFYCKADKLSAYNCRFVSKQDTMGINSGREYYENCVLEGTVDYICGSATAVFNNCELKFAAGPNLDGSTKDSGHITAPATSEANKGYLFYNCEVTGTDTAVAGNFGRPWGNPGGPEAIFYNTVINSNKSGECLISAAGWADMSGTKKDEARFYEYGSVDAKGNAIDTSKRVRNAVAPFGTVLNEWQVLEFNPYNYTKGKDGWDPMNMAPKYTEFESVLNSIQFDDKVSGDITLPQAPAGYEFYWESDSDYAVISDDQTKVSVLRPAYGSEAIKASLTVYIRKTGTEYGIKDATELTIQPNDTTEGTFNVSGTASLNSVAAEDIEISLSFINSGAVIASKSIVIPMGSQTAEYNIDYLPEGTYEVVASSVTNGYRVISPEEGSNITGVSGKPAALNIDVRQLKEVTVSTSDFSESWAAALATVADTNCTAAVVTGTESDTANIGVGNKVYKFTKAENTTVKNTVGFYWDLVKAIEENGGTFSNTDKFEFSMDFLLEKDKTLTDDKNGYMANDYSFIDLTSKLGSGANSANQSRYVRYGVHKNWNQFNFFNASNTRINGNNTQFDKNSKMANKWYHIVANVDLKNKVITTTLYDRETNTMLNGKAFRIAEPDVDGNNVGYPTELIENALYLALYMDKNGSTTNKIEFYIDNVSLTYQDFK